MADENRPTDIQFHQSLVQQGGLLVRTPDAIARPLAKSEPGPVKGHDPMVACKMIDETAKHEITGHRTVAVEQDNSRPGAPLDVMETDTLDGDEFAFRGSAPFRTAGERVIRQSCRGQSQRAEPDQLAYAAGTVTGLAPGGFRHAGFIVPHSADRPDQHEVEIGAILALAQDVDAARAFVSRSDERNAAVDCDRVPDALSVQIQNIDRVREITAAHRRRPDGWPGRSRSQDNHPRRGTFP